MTSQEDSLRDIQEEIFHEVFKAFIEEKRRKNPKLCPYCNAKLLFIGQARIHYAQHQNELLEIKRRKSRRNLRDGL